MSKLLLANTLLFCLLSLTTAGIAGDKPNSQTSQVKDKPVNGFVLIDMGSGGGDSRPEPSLPGNAEPGTGYDPSGTSGGGSSEGSGDTEYPTPFFTRTVECSVFNPRTMENEAGDQIICVAGGGVCAYQSPCIVN